MLKTTELLSVKQFLVVLKKPIMSVSNNMSFHYMKAYCYVNRATFEYRFNFKMWILYRYTCVPLYKKYVVTILFHEKSWINKPFWY